MSDFKFSIKNIQYQFLIACILQYLVTNVTFAKDGPIINLDRIDKSIEIGDLVGIYFDSTSNLSFQQIIQPSFDNLFKFNTEKIINRSSSKANLWLKMTYIHNSNDDIWLEVGHSLSIWELDYYIMDSVSGDSFLSEKFELGALRPSTNKLYPSKYYCLPILQTNHEPKTIYLRISGVFPIILRPQLCKEEYLDKKTQKEFKIFYLFMGIIIAMILYNSFLFISTKEKIYLVYVFYVAYTLVVVSFTQGHNLFYFPLFYKKLTIVTAPQFLAMTLFLSYYFELRKNSKILFRIVWSFSSFFIVVLPFLNMFNLINYVNLVNLFQITSPLYYVFHISIGIYFLLKKYFGAIYYIFGWTVIMLSMLLYFMMINGFLESNDFTINIPYLGLSIEVLIFAFALGNKINKLKDDNTKIQQEKNVILADQNQTLDSMVKQKTKELDRALTTTKTLNEELQMIIEELQASNEELSRTNEIVNSQKINLEATLTNLKTTQSKLIQSEKMASLGILTAGVAHEINNPLNFIMGTYFGLKKYYSSTMTNIQNENIDKLLKNLHTGIIRASNIIQSLNEFSSDHEKMEEEIDITHLLNNCLTILNYQLKNNIRVVKHFNHPSDLLLKGNVGQIHQVFVNIITNSLQAIKNKGVIEITTNKTNGYLIIEVKDTGEGISPENIKKVMDPFFTTKDPGKGTGLGLSIAYNIVKKHGGNMEFESDLKKGTMVKVFLPISEINAN